MISYGWSDESPEAAQAEAERRAARVINWVKDGTDFVFGEYGYPDRPMREEVLREFHDEAGHLTAVISRNNYGCQVLNTAAALFVDIDAPRPKGLGFLAGLIGLLRPNRNGKSETVQLTVRNAIQAWLSRHPEWGWRAYQTRAGIRLLATHQPVMPEDPATQDAFQHFKADPLYQKLCANQKCFRARLTPKPWRCGADKIRIHWPWRDTAADVAFRKWEQGYQAAAAQYATCRLLGHFGNKAIHPSLNELVQLHDQITGVATMLPLA